ncbi:MAG: hypothetical protein AAB784_00320 [Patescibacteria group bacterium]
MKKLSMLIIYSFSIILAGCATNEKSLSPQEEKTLAKKLEYQKREDIQFDVVPRVYYIKDWRPDSPLCFAYLWKQKYDGQAAVGGPALATVPCEQVDKLLASSQQSN